MESFLDSPISIYPEIQLRVQDGSDIRADVLAYPEDKYLIVDPYSSITAPEEGSSSIINYAMWSLPRRLGEVMVSKGEDIRADYLMRMVVIDFEAIHHVQVTVLEEAVREVFRKASILRSKSICFDRLDLIERHHSAFKIVSTLVRLLIPFQLQTANRIKLLVFNFEEGPSLRRFEIACGNLYPYMDSMKSESNA